MAAIHAVLEQQKLGGDLAAAAARSMQAAARRRRTLDEQRRVFSLPPGAITLRELTFGTAGLGYSVWDAGVGMSLWLSQHAEAVRGKRVLELGSGVGIAGIAAALCGGAHVTLSDYGFAADGGGAAWPPRGPSCCDPTSRPTRAAAACPSGATRSPSTGTPRCGSLALRPARQYEAIVGSDLCYYEDDVDALAATIVAHLQPGARAAPALAAGPHRAAAVAVDARRARRGDDRGARRRQQFWADRAVPRRVLRAGLAARGVVV